MIRQHWTTRLSSCLKFKKAEKNNEDTEISVDGHGAVVITESTKN